MIDFWRFSEVAASLVVLATVVLVNHFVFDQKHIPTIVVLIGFGVTGSIHFLSGLLQRHRAARAADGWHYLTPAPIEWFGFVLGAGLSLFFVWIYYFVGTARPDPVSQMQGLKWLVVFFSAGTVISGFFSFGISTRWNDEKIERRIPFLAPKTILLRNIVAIHREVWSDLLVIIDGDGNQIRFSPHKNGAEALLLKILGIKEEEEESAASS